MPSVDKETVRHDELLIEPGSRHRERIELLPGEPTVGIRCRLHGTIEKSGTDNNDAAIRDEAVQRFLELALHTVSPNRDILIGTGGGRVSLRNLSRFHDLNVSQVSTIQQPSASDLNSNGTQTTDFEIRFTLWAMRRYLAFRREAFWPAWDGVMAPSVDKFVLDVFPNRTAVNADSDAGTDAFLSAGSDDYAFSDGPHFRVEQFIAPNLQGPGESGAPRFLPTYHETRSDTFTSANEHLDHVVEHGEAMDLVMFRHEEGSRRVAQAISDGRLNAVSILAKRLQILDERIPEFLEEDARDDFDAYDGADTGDSFQGYYPYLLAAGGRGFSRVHPDEFTNFRYVFDVDDPNTDPGAVTIFSALLEDV